ncbi:proline-rich protein 2-like [Cervus elaphus]|uniref:proline-rich protein 2-like n=1 Tax=Cervus elaphus TaxID=9860 RepID=UPI001CC2D7B5|nr:proline-rich protein 2-like [Cervus elaphus]
MSRMGHTHSRPGCAPPPPCDSPRHPLLMALPPPTHTGSCHPDSAGLVPTPAHPRALSPTCLGTRRCRVQVPEDPEQAGAPGLPSPAPAQSAQPAPGPGGAPPQGLLSPPPHGHKQVARVATVLVDCERFLGSQWLGEPVSLQGCRFDFLQRGQSLFMPPGPGTVGFSLLFTEVSVLTAAAFHTRDSPLGIPRRDLAGPPAGWPTRPNLGVVPGPGLGHTRDSVRMGGSKAGPPVHRPLFTGPSRHPLVPSRRVAPLHPRLRVPWVSDHRKPSPVPCCRPGLRNQPVLSGPLHSLLVGVFSALGAPHPHRTPGVHSAVCLRSPSFSGGPKADSVSLPAGAVLSASVPHSWAPSGGRGPPGRQPSRRDPSARRPVGDRRETFPLGSALSQLR